MWCVTGFCGFFSFFLLVPYLLLVNDDHRTQGLVPGSMVPLSLGISPFSPPSIPPREYPPFSLAICVLIGNCFHLLSAMNNGATNTRGAAIFLQDPFWTLPYIAPKVELLNPMLILFLAFWGMAALFPTAATLFFNPTRGAGAKAPLSQCPCSH